jgi:hypothetical protein
MERVDDKGLLKFELPSHILGAVGCQNIEEYGRFQQHLVLLEDRARVAAYLSAIKSRPPGGVVVDVGAGTGLLSMLALQHGFEHAFLIEPSRKIAAYARHLARLNGFEDRTTVIESTLEAVNLADLPDRIDLVVSETLSALLFGFGSWDALSSLVPRLTRPDAIIPLTGRLFAAPTGKHLSSRTPTSDGLALLSEMGLKVDLFERTFRSGGNVFDKGPISRKIATGELKAQCIGRFDMLSSRGYIDLPTANFTFDENRTIVGLVSFWEVVLAAAVNPITLCSLDPSLTSWYPYYVPFREPFHLPVGSHMQIKMRLLPVDVPYKYAFQFVSRSKELTNVLYW